MKAITNSNYLIGFSFDSKITIINIIFVIISNIIISNIIISNIIISNIIISNIIAVLYIILGKYSLIGNQIVD